MSSNHLKWAALLALLAGAAPAFGATTPPCQKTMKFGPWLAGVKEEAASAGVSRATIEQALAGVAFAPDIVRHDRGQSVFSQTFLEFAVRMANDNRRIAGQRLIKKHASTFAQIEQEYGVPAPVIVAFWALETDFGANMGDLPTIRSLASLAYDCRRPERFRGELIAALQIADAGDLSLDEMRGAWAGELGHMQFLPSYYLKHAVDFDRDGRRDLIRSVPDVLASTANYLKFLGWTADQPWLEQVAVPGDLDWSEADLTITHPRSHWAGLGVRALGGKALAADGLEASLLLPMGRKGPAFLAYPNFRTYLVWNESLIYSTTAAYLATRIAGGPALTKPKSAPVPFGYKQILELQTLLAARGYDVGKVDGKLGAATRKSVKDMQLKLGLPADSYPTPELVAALRGGG